jgi:hypothetical protein
VRRIVVVTRRKSKNYGRSSIRGNHMNLGIPSAAGFADDLRSVLFRAPVPSAKILIDSFLSDNPSRDKGWSCYLTGENSTQRGDL